MEPKELPLRLQTRKQSQLDGEVYDHINQFARFYNLFSKRQLRATGLIAEVMRLNQHR